MFFDECPMFKVTYVYKINRKASYDNSGPRSIGAVAFRLSGESVFHVSGKTYYASPGSLLYIPQGVGFIRESTAEELVIVHLQSSEADRAELEVVYPEDAEFAKEQMQMICREWNEKKQGYQQRSTAMLYMLLAKLQTAQSGLSAYKYTLIQQGVDYINSSFDAPQITVGMLAEKCNISPEYFRRLYKEKYGISPQAAIVEKRLEKACHLLQIGEFSVSEIAAQCGFRDAKYFSTLFRKKMHTTPQAYKTKYNQ